MKLTESEKRDIDLIEKTNRLVNQFGFATRGVSHNDIGLICQYGVLDVPMKVWEERLKVVFEIASEARGKND